LATDQLVPKDRLIQQMRDIALHRDTGLLSIVTDTGRAVLVRFSQGTIVGAHSRSKDIGEATAILREAQSVRFSYAPSKSEGKRDDSPGLMSVGAFIELLAPPTGSRLISSSAETPAQPTAGSPASGPPNPPPLATGISKDARGSLERLSIEIVGPIAQFLVEEALETATTLRDAIKQIAQSIPDRDVSRRFTEEARRRLPEVD
jgi:hypothetical protein